MASFPCIYICIYQYTHISLNTAGSFFICHANLNGLFETHLLSLLRWLLWWNSDNSSGNRETVLVPRSLSEHQSSSVTGSRAKPFYKKCSSATLICRKERQWFSHSMKEPWYPWRRKRGSLEEGLPHRKQGASLILFNWPWNLVKILNFLISNFLTLKFKGSVGFVIFALLRQQIPRSNRNLDSDMKGELKGVALVWLKPGTVTLSFDPYQEFQSPSESWGLFQTVWGEHVAGFPSFFQGSLFPIPEILWLCALITKCIVIACTVNTGF